MGTKGSCEIMNPFDVPEDVAWEMSLEDFEELNDVEKPCDGEDGCES